jgi:hypothetical protein
LQNREFGCSEDTEGVVCWHAAQGTLGIHSQLTLSPGEIGIQQQMSALQGELPVTTRQESRLSAADSTGQCFSLTSVEDSSAFISG